MNFLHPLFLLGAIGVAAPVWLHLRRKQRTNLQPFSALRFLDDQPAPRDMPLRLRDILLLLLRVLALLALVAAFAWPFISGASRLIQSEVRIYVLDNTLSHQAGDGFSRAQREIAREIRHAGAETQIGVVEIAARSRVIAELGTSREEAVAAVEALKPSHQRGSYLEAFRLAAGMLDRSLGSSRKILVYGDRQRNQWDENINVPPFLRDVEVIMAEPAGKNDSGNLFAANTRVRRVSLRDGSAVDLTLDLGSQAPNRNASITIRSNGEEVLRRDISLDGGQGTVQTAWKAGADTWLRGEVELTGQPDALPMDNKSYFAVPPLEPGKIGVLSRSAYLRAALDPEISRGFWDVTFLTPDTVRKDAAGDSPRFDALVVDSDYLQSKEARDLLLKHLNNGRGILLFVSRATPLVEGFLRSLGFQMGEERRLAGSEREFRYAALNHPALEPFSHPDFGDLLGVRMEKYFKLTPEKADGLLFAGTGDPILFETKGTKGKMLVFGFSPEVEFTNWPLRQDFLPFLDLCLGHVRAIPDQQISVEPGEICFRTFADGAGASFILASDGKEAARAVADEAGRLRISVPDQPGIYELCREKGPGQYFLEGLISVSASSKESKLEFIEGQPVALEAWKLPPADKTAAAPEVVTREGLDQHYWWWLLAAAAVLLTGEMIWLFNPRTAS